MGEKGGRLQRASSLRASPVAGRGDDRGREEEAAPPPSGREGANDGERTTDRRTRCRGRWRDWSGREGGREQVTPGETTVAC